MDKNIYAAIAMALYEYQGNNVHDKEPGIITIQPRQTMWNAKFLSLTAKPSKKEMKEFKYTIDGKEYKVQIEGVEDNIASVNVNGEAYKVEMEKEAEPEKKKVVLGKPAAASDDAEATPAANVNTANAVKAPLPGTITSIEVTVGQEVKAGDTVVVLEAMKMQNNIEAEKDGKVTAICVKPGQAVLEEDALIVIE